jgi:hypothetical protein
MKDILKLLAVIVGGIIGAGVPLTVAYHVWSWTMAQVPLTSEWAGLIKVGVSFLMFALGGGVTIACAFLLSVFLAGLVVAMVE